MVVKLKTYDIPDGEELPNSGEVLVGGEGRNSVIKEPKGIHLPEKVHHPVECVDYFNCCHE